MAQNTGKARRCLLFAEKEKQNIGKHYVVDTGHGTGSLKDIMEEDQGDETMACMINTDQEMSDGDLLTAARQLDPICVTVHVSVVQGTEANIHCWAFCAMTGGGGGEGEILWGMVPMQHTQDHDSALLYSLHTAVAAYGCDKVDEVKLLCSFGDIYGVTGVLDKLKVLADRLNITVSLMTSAVTGKLQSAYLAEKLLASTMDSITSSAERLAIK